MASKPLSPVVPVLHCPHYRPRVLIPQPHECVTGLSHLEAVQRAPHHRCSPDHLRCSSVWPLCFPRCLLVPSWHYFPDRWTQLLPAGPKYFITLLRWQAEPAEQRQSWFDLMFWFLVPGEANEKAASQLTQKRLHWPPSRRKWCSYLEL